MPMHTAAGGAAPEKRPVPGQGAPRGLDRYAPSLAAGGGWTSLALGLFLTIAPATGATLMGLGDRPGEARAVGLADLVIGAGLLLGRDQARWMLARALGNAAIAGLGARALADGTPRRGRAAGLLALMAGLTVLDGLVARRLR